MSLESASTAVAERFVKPARMPWVSPYLMVKDPAAALDFYESAFGFERRAVMAQPDGSIMHAEITWRDGVVMMGPQGAFGGTTLAPATSGTACPMTLYVYCDDVDALAERARLAGAEVKYGPADTFYGDRICHLVDLDGYVWCFATHNGVMAPPDPNCAAS